MAERSKAPDSSSGGAIRVGSNPTAVNFLENNTAPDAQFFLCLILNKEVDSQFSEQLPSVALRFGTEISV